MKRHGPEEMFEELPLFAAAEAAERRAREGIRSSAQHAEDAQPGWKKAALEVVRQYAREHSSFLTEEIDVVVPPEADPRAVGSVMRAAVSAGFVEADGVARANSSNRSFKTRWKSLIYARTEKLA